MKESDLKQWNEANPEWTVLKNSGPRFRDPIYVQYPGEEHPCAVIGGVCADGVFRHVDVAAPGMRAISIREALRQIKGAEDWASRKATGSDS